MLATPRSKASWTRTHSVARRLFRQRQSRAARWEPMFVFIDGSSSSATMYIGVYNDNGGHPGTLLSQASSSSLTAEAWNSINMPAASIVSGAKYWIAVLGTGSGTIKFRDRSGGCASEGSAQSNLVSLPQTWSSGTRYSDCPLSAYGKSLRRISGAPLIGFESLLRLMNARTDRSSSALWT